MYQFDFDGELVIVTQEPVSDFSGMQDPEEPYTERYKHVYYVYNRYKTVGEKKFQTQIYYLSHQQGLL